MNPLVLDEKQLLADVERLKNEFVQTQALYREVCALMFFRFGITPTANKLYQLVRRGSMSAPAEALRKFWEELREKSSARIEHPDMPESLQQAAGELTAALWLQARQAAQATLATLRADAVEQVAQAQDTARRQADAHDAAQARAATLTARLDTADQLREQVSRQLAVEQATHASARAELDGVRRELVAAQAEVERICASFATELDQFRKAAAAAQERHQAIERRTLLDLDQERTRNGKLARQLEQTQVRLSSWMDQQALEKTRLQQDINLLRERAGELEGRIAAAHDDRKQLEDRLFRSENELKTLRQSHARPVAVKRARRRLATP